MTKPEQPLPAGGPRREEAAILEIEHTIASPSTVRLLAAFFLTAIAAVPIAEFAAVRLRGGEGIAIAWSHLSGIPGEIRADLAQAGSSGRWDRILSANRIALTQLSEFELALENESLLARSLRPSAQLALTGWLGAGNERVYPGHDGWVFYRQDVEYVTGRGFLDPAQIRRRMGAAPEWTTAPQPDPRLAIAQFRDDLEARGIALIVMPTPVKPGVHPEMLARRYAGAAGVLQNPSYRDFVADLRRAGVNVFDPSEALAAARRSGPQYLATDTHWRPESMEAVAELVGGVIRNQGPLAATADPAYRVERLEVRNTGDAARMLDLPEDAPLFPPEAVWLRRILQPDGSLWRSARDADVLVLGDSFSNIYTLESMGWGTSAGFVEQLSYVLRRPIDRLVQNDQGAFATREMLRRDDARLDGKRVVVYQFAARELMVGDWKLFPATTLRRAESWQGNGNRTVGFASDSGIFRVSWTTRDQRPPANGTFLLTIRSAISGRPIQTVADHRGEGSGSVDFRDDPRLYDLIVDSTNVDWSITVDELGAVASETPGRPSRDP